MSRVLLLAFIATACVHRIDVDDTALPQSADEYRSGYAEDGRLPGSMVKKSILGATAISLSSAPSTSTDQLAVGSGATAPGIGCIGANTNDKICFDGTNITMTTTSGAIFSANRNWGQAAAQDLWNGGLAIPSGKALYLNGNTATIGWTLSGGAITSFGASVDLSAAKVNTGNNWGTVTLSGGTQTATVTSGARCVCTDQTAAAAVRCSVATTTLTVVGTGTDVVTYFCDK